LVNDGWDIARRVWHELHRPTAVYRGTISQGLAVSLNSLERQQGIGELLPRLDIRGVLLDRVQNDWVLFGEAVPERPGLPLDAIAIALRAVRLHLEAPGIDIQPQRGGRDASQAVQTVRYFGGLAGTVVGKWFFQFDYWMKRTSLGYEPAAVPGLPVYWHRAVEALEREVTTRPLSGSTRWTRSNRYWLCAGRFAAIEGDDTLTLEHTPLLVLAERVPAAGEAMDSPALPCASRGTDDPLAAEFAHWLTEHLGKVARVVPVAEIEAFSRLLAGFTWLTQQDPYRDLRPWLHAPLAPADTPTTVSTLTRQAGREYPVMQNSSLLRQQYWLELSGGVLIAPELKRSRVRDDSLRLLHRAVLTARPAGKPAVWRFTFRPPSP
jgi:hypothetical protein